MFFSIFMNMWFVLGLLIGAIASRLAFNGEFELINLLIAVIPSTLLLSLLGISIGARYSLALGFSFITVSLITSSEITKCLFVGTAIGISAFALIVAVELIEGVIELLKEAANAANSAIKTALSERKIAFINYRRATLREK